MELELLTAIAMIVGPTGAAWVGVKTSLNGMKEGMGRIESKVDRINGRVTRNEAEIAAIKAVDKDRHR